MSTCGMLVLLLSSVIAETTLDKRILLHNDVDIVQAIQDLKAENAQLQSRLEYLETANNSSGSTYVRWGRTTCPTSGTTLAYSGYIGGGRYDQTGAAVNHVCLTDEPLWDQFDDAVNSHGKMYGSEYDFFFDKPGMGVKFFGSALRNDDALCAVCHSPRSASMMIPGRNQCYPGWTEEYRGYLVSGRYSETAATEFICLDRRPEAVVGGTADDNDNVLYLVEGVCGGSLECPPYINGRELTCVVCTK